MAKKTKPKKKPQAPSVVTPALLIKALNSVIGMSDHSPDNEGRVFNFIITNELHEVMNTKGNIFFDGIFTDKKKLIDQLHEAQVPEWVKVDEKSTYVHEILDIEENSDEGVWIDIKVKLFGLTVLRDYDGLKYYREATEYKKVAI